VRRPRYLQSTDRDLARLLHDGVATAAPEPLFFCLVGLAVLLALPCSSLCPTFSLLRSPCLTCPSLSPGPRRIRLNIPRLSRGVRASFVVNFSHAAQLKSGFASDRSA